MHPLRKWTHLSLFIFSLSTLASCGGGGGGGGGTSTLEGTIALNNGQSGTVTLNVNTALAKNSRFSIVGRAEAQTGGNATGNCITPTCPNPGVPLSGNFNTTTNTFSVSGSSGNSGCPEGTVTFNGTYTPGTGTSSGSMSGTITSTSGGTTTTIGGFSGFNTTNTPGATNHCGTFNGGGKCVGGTNVGASCTTNTDCAGGGTCSGSDLGVFNVSINGTQLTGSAQDTCQNDNPVGLNATVSGNTFSGCSTDPNGPSPICGTIAADGNSVTGFFQKKRECLGGSNGGNSCTTDADCPSGTCSALIGCFSGSTSFCSTNTPPSGCNSPPTPCGPPTCTFQTCP